MRITTHSKCDPINPTIIGLFENEKPDSGRLGKSLAELIQKHQKQKSFSGKSNESVSTHLSKGEKLQKVILFGLGEENKLHETSTRNFGAKMIRASADFQQKEINISIPPALQNHLQALAEGLIMGNYDPALYKTDEEAKKKGEKKTNTINLICTDWNTDQRSRLEKGKSVGETVNYIRTLVNSAPDQLNTEQLVREIKLTAKENQMKVTDFDKKKLEKMKMGGILAVNRGSAEPAHMMVIEYNPAPISDNRKPKTENPLPIVLVGKGIIFDTGGISLKPSTHLSDMQLDMAGAAVVLGVFKLLKQFDIKRRVVGIIPITDNAIGNTAYRPSEIVTTYSGKTVEILNTDAEGRMILSDALYYGATQYKPEYMIDFATLTGACMVALGFRTAGLFGNDEELLDKLNSSGKNTDEGLCVMPITDADEKGIEGQLADLANIAHDHAYAGASRAAAFLKNFITDTKWAHIDIAGTAFTKNPKDYETTMATGFGVRMMIDFFEKLPFSVNE
ncbi:MAG: leucyl aminopeptidase [bacterium]|nr:leucyl aminopeptidase [bacterium]